jgi:hypothetical protein
MTQYYNFDMQSPLKRLSHLRKLTKICRHLKNQINMVVLNNKIEQKLSSIQYCNWINPLCH